MHIKEHFTRKKIIDNLARYELFYQVALGSLLKSDSNKMSNDIEFQLALGSIYELLKDIQDFEDFDEIYETELSKQSAMDAVQNFVNENLEAVKNSEIKVEEIINDINDNKFFNQTMIDICNDNLQSQLQKWEHIITPQLALAIMQSLEELEKQQ
ncbi:MAG: hypothetical protein ACERKK_11660 [Poseidonibacter sp.]|uniref:hypothetical protein n=1 Tax=Poseidonibacter sp. TaxID=2321188 RepID=UPI00359DBA68